MTYTELDLAQVDRRVAAVERCVERQREVLHQHLAGGLNTEVPVRQLAEFEAALTDLRRNRRQIRDAIAAANTQELLDLFTQLPPPRAPARPQSSHHSSA